MGADADATVAVEVRALLERFEGRFPSGWDPTDTCLKFLQARRGDLEAAATMLEASLEWRQNFVEGGVSTLLHYHLEEEPAVREGFPQCFHKVDRMGRPVQYFLVGSQDAEKLHASTTLERLLRWNVHRAEHTICVKYPRCSAAAGTHVSTTTTIMDLDGAHLGQFTSEVRSYTKLYFKMLGDNFPGNLGKIYVINCPILFAGVWAVLKHFLPETDRERIQLLGGPNEYEPILLADIDPANLPTRFGGNDTSFSAVRDVGPWDTPIPTGAEELTPPGTPEREAKATPTTEAAVASEAAVACEASDVLKAAPPPTPPPLVEHPPSSPEALV